MATNQSDFAVYVTDKKGKQHCLLPGDEIPAWAGKQITNPYVLGVDPDAEDDEPGTDGPPPQSGRGSGADKWAAYAEAHGVDADGKDRDEIIAACQEAGVPVE